MEQPCLHLAARLIGVVAEEEEILAPGEGIGVQARHQVPRGFDADVARWVGQSLLKCEQNVLTSGFGEGSQGLNGHLPHEGVGVLQLPQQGLRHGRFISKSLEEYGGDGSPVRILIGG